MKYLGRYLINLLSWQDRIDFRRCIFHMVLNMFCFGHQKLIIWRGERKRSTRQLFAFVILIAFPGFALASGTSHGDPVASVILSVTFLFVFGLIGRYLAKRLHQPAVLGELLMGVILGNIAYACGSQLVVVLREGAAVFNIMKELLQGSNLSQAVQDTVSNPYYAKQVLAALHSNNGTEYFKIAYIVDIFSRYGVIFLLFVVGLESSVEEMKQTGWESFRVALIGVIVPGILGFIAAKSMLPDASFSANLFVGATLCATSIGITARVLQEMRIVHIGESKTILGAAMLDDVFGLIILAIVSSVVIQGEVDLFMTGRIIIMAILFFAGVLFLGPWLIQRLVHFFRFLNLWEAKLFIAFIFLMSLAWLANLVQLATIIGAFAAGVILHDGYFSTTGPYNVKVPTIKELVSPWESLLAPLFFILIGVQVKLETFFDWHVILLALGLIVAAIVGKLVSGLGASAKNDRLFIGIGMLPRGEVGLVFASIGRTLGVISDTLFSAIVLMVILTTFCAPPLLKMRFQRNPALQAK